MKDLPRKVLCDLMAKHGQDLSNDGQRCEALLRDFCGQARSEISILIAALSQGVVTELKSSKQAVPTEVLLARLSQRLQDHLYLQPGAAMWAIDTWAIALGVIQEPRSYNASDLETSQEDSQDNSEAKSQSSPLSQSSSPQSPHWLWGVCGIMLVSMITLAGFGYHRFEKDQQIQAEMQAEVEQSFKDSTLSSTGMNLQLKNSCSEPIRVALRYKDTSNTWRTDAWWKFQPGESSYMSYSNSKLIKVFSPIIYFYAEVTTPGKSYSWEGVKDFTIKDRSYPMRFKVLQVNWDKNWNKNLQLDLTCLNL